MPQAPPPIIVIFVKLIFNVPVCDPRAEKAAVMYQLKRIMLIRPLNDSTLPLTLSHWDRKTGKFAARQNKF